MPAKAVDYSKTIIYKLVCNDTYVKDCYVGQTRDMGRRKSQHKRTCSNETSKDYTAYVYRFIRDNGGFENWTIVQIEAYACNNRAEADARERFWLEALNATLNVRVPGRSRAEHHNDNVTLIKQRRHNFYTENVDSITQTRRNYYAKNADAVKQRVRAYQLDNADTIKQRKQAYLEANRDEINRRDRERYAKKKAEQAAAAVTSTG